MELANAVAKDLGVKLEIKDMKFDGLLPALKTNTVDMVIGGMAPTEERKKSVDFSEPYYKAKQSVLIRKEDENKYKTVEDLKGKSIGAQKSSTQEQIAQTEISNPNLVSIPVFTDLIMELRTKKIDALVCENTVAKPYTIKYDNLKIVNINFKKSEKDTAIAVNKGKSDLVKRLNKVIDELIKENKINTWIDKYSTIASKGIKEQ
ncbi:transporter substrate-binding domain-containing protein [Clostridium sp. DMHC 10]|nr:transporter substrate-binding domain-containing protein [Clostridium sp. DMHC 10]